MLEDALEVFLKVPQTVKWEAVATVVCAEIHRGEHLLLYATVLVFDADYRESLVGGEYYEE